MNRERKAPQAIACRNGELTPEEHTRRDELRESLKQATGQVVETAEGYCFRFLEAGAFLEAAEWVTLERRCCPFLDFELEWPSDAAPSLHLTGGQGVKEFLASGLAPFEKRPR